MSSRGAASCAARAALSPRGRVVCPGSAGTAPDAAEKGGGRDSKRGRGLQAPGRSRALSFSELDARVRGCSLLCLLLLLLACHPAWAKEIPLSRGEIRIPMGQSVSFDLGTLSRNQGSVELELLARLDSEAYAGSSYFMKLTLNGEVVNAAATRSASRLLNKKLVSPVARNLEAPWYGNNAWRVLYAPDFGGLGRFLYYQGNPYQTVLDVTDLVDPAGSNKLEITNTANRKVPPGARAKYDLVLKELVLRVRPQTSRSAARSTLDRDLINRGAPGAGPAPYTGRLLPGGGFSVQLGARTLRFGSRISYPNAGFNELVPSDRPHGKGQPGFKVETKVRADGGQVVATGPDYRITRTVRFTPRKVEITDQVSNLHQNAKLGLSFANSVQLEDPHAKVRLAGIADNSINSYYSPGNPSVYLSLPDHGLGVVIEDDVFRNQATLFYDPESHGAGMSTDKLCLPAGGSYRLKWSVYPVASRDYYDFINLVREDWGSNYTVQGAWTFFNPDTILATPVQKIREQFTRLGIRYACVGGGWVDRKADPKRIGFGAGVLDPYWSDYRNRIRLASKRIKEALPDCKVYLYYDTQRDTSEGGTERFRDSLLIDAKGGRVSTDWSGRFSQTYSVVASRENSFGRAMLEVAESYLAEMQLDGLYWDEMEGVGYGKPLISYNVWDGYSCELDPTRYTIRREIGISTLLGEGHRLAVIERVRRRGGDLMGNSPISTKKMLALKPQRMVEIQHNENWNYEGNLGTPLGYAGARTDFGNWVRAIGLANLLVGTRYDYGYDISRYVFPFTPIELHAGYLLGKERIIATHGGNYGWPGASDLSQGYYFNSEGKLVEKALKTEIRQEARTAVEVGRGEAVVLVRLPVSVKGGPASVAAVKYGPEGVSFTLESAVRCQVEVRSGPLPVRGGQGFKVVSGGRSRTLQADQDGVLRLTLGPASEPTEVEIRAL